MKGCKYKIEPVSELSPREHIRYCKNCTWNENKERCEALREKYNAETF